MKNEQEKVRFEQVAYIGVLNPDDTLKIGIPLYVKVIGDMSPEQEQQIKDISTEFIRKYEPQISEYFTKLRKEQILKNNSDLSHE